MNDVGPNILKVSPQLADSLKVAGLQERYSVAQTLFETDDQNDGVFLVLKGKVCLRLKDVPRLDRVFRTGSLLGLPSTFTGEPYRLTAVALDAADVVHVSEKRFMELMRERPELCREATDILCKEAAFIQGALAGQRRCAKVAC
jgi:CRP-like cAMP-binding protein